MHPPLLQIQEIDAQHEEILSRLADMRSPRAMTADWYSSFEGMLQLSELCRRHFSVEESLMRLHRYQRANAHAEEHREFLLLLDALLAQAAQQSPSVTAVEFMERWWDEHIRIHDQAYVDWFSRVPASVLIDPPNATPAPG